MARYVFLTNLLGQKKTTESLLKESHASSTFYLFLFLSAFIVTLGLLINNAVVIIGGMLVAPFLFPFLLLGMGIATSNMEAIARSLKIIGTSVCIVFATSFLTTFLLNGQGATEQMKLVSTLNLVLFLVACTSGIIAACAWAKENISTTLPGIAITIALIPPLAASGIAVALLSKELFSGSFMLFLVNFLGITVASIIVFVLFGFSQSQKTEEQKIKEETTHDTITL